MKKRKRGGREADGKEDFSVRRGWCGCNGGGVLRGKKTRCDKPMKSVDAVVDQKRGSGQEIEGPGGGGMEKG